MKPHTPFYSSSYLRVSDDMQEGDHGKVTGVPAELRRDYSSALHSVRKQNMKPWKQPIAPMPPVPPKVYKVDAADFRDLVQKLTGKPAASSSFRQQHLKSTEAADFTRPPLIVRRPLFSRANIAEPLAQRPMFSSIYQGLLAETSCDANKLTKMPTAESMNSHGVSNFSSSSSSSPSSQNWYSFPLLSPGTLSSLEQTIHL
ncbi:uncharacterized protein LOC110809097 [Carica papaya]|uniref:uncharacterized protein LOC110809097 n=1 Tax=Carica papaya TaxID=3649 RepID=UPI000B8CAECC|nr:uncharacterized protein LOC110809097 [Carica papaya]